MGKAFRIMLMSLLVLRIILPESGWAQSDAAVDSTK